MLTIILKPELKRMIFEKAVRQTAEAAIEHDLQGRRVVREIARN